MRRLMVPMLVIVSIGGILAAGRERRVTDEDDDNRVVRVIELSRLERFAAQFDQDWDLDFPGGVWEYSDLIGHAQRHFDRLEPSARNTLRREMKEFLDLHYDKSPRALAKAWYRTGANFPPEDQIKEALREFYERM